jgi:CRP/FNR family transcriptional regulator, anaerobic regulatory protein
MINLDFDLNLEYQNFELDIQIEIASYFTPLDFQKNEYILEKGQVCKGIYYIETGLCRSYLVGNGKEYTTSFGLDQNIICSPVSYLKQIPSEEYIQALDKTFCFFLSYESIQFLLNEHFVFNDYVRRLYEKLFIEAENLLNSIRIDNALQRYEKFMKETPHLLNRIPLGYLASYLGMSQETLSRMRGKI